MSDDRLAEQIAAARPLVRATWDEGRAHRVLARVERAKHRRSVARAGGAFLAVAATVAVVVIGVAPGRAPAWADQAFLSPVRLSDGSTAVPTGMGARMYVRAEPDRDVFVLGSGGVRVDVVKAVRVEAGKAAVESRSAGSRFIVEYAEGRVRVAVYQGEARVLFEATETFVRPGEVQSFPPAPVLGTPAMAEEHRAAAAHRQKAPAPVVEPEPVPAQVPGGAVESPPRDQAGEAFELADAARREGRPQEAIAPLRSVVEGVPSDPRAPLAAFTLGRVLLDDLKRPADAAAAFAQARQLAPSGPLAEDALAREVESWAAAHDAVRARATAEEYGRLFPGGRRARFVRQLGGLE
jgi:transmembrane sensor